MNEEPMPLGAFSISLSVKDLGVSKAFYGHMGFEVIAGKEEENWLILRNGDAKIGIFQGQFEGNLLTFNPPDVRSIQRSLKSEGMVFMVEAKSGSRISSLEFFEAGDTTMALPLGPEIGQCCGGHVTLSFEIDTAD